MMNFDCSKCHGATLSGIPASTGVVLEQKRRTLLENEADISADDPSNGGASQITPALDTSASDLEPEDAACAVPSESLPYLDSLMDEDPSNISFEDFYANGAHLHNETKLGNLNMHAKKSLGFR